MIRSGLMKCSRSKRRTGRLRYAACARARLRELVALRLPLTRFETEVIELESRDAAQEALFCVREDGMSMEEVAVEGHYPYRRVDFLLEDIPIDVQQNIPAFRRGTCWNRYRKATDLNYVG